LARVLDGEHVCAQFDHVAQGPAEAIDRIVIDELIELPAAMVGGIEIAKAGEIRLNRACSMPPVPRIIEFIRVRSSATTMELWQPARGCQLATNSWDEASDSGDFTSVLTLVHRRRMQRQRDRE